MTTKRVKELIKEIKEYDGYIQDFDKEYSGACPCFWVDKKVNGKKLEVHGRCWRVSNHGQDLYVWGELSKKSLTLIGKAIKENLDKQEWYGDYTLLIGHPKKHDAINY